MVYLESILFYPDDKSRIAAKVVAATFRPSANRKLLSLAPPTLTLTLTDRWSVFLGLVFSRIHLLSSRPGLCQQHQPYVALALRCVESGRKEPLCGRWCMSAPLQDTPPFGRVSLFALHVHTPRVEPTYYYFLLDLFAVLRSGRAWGWTQKRRRSSLLTSQWSRHFVRCALRTLACTIPSSSRPS